MTDLSAAERLAAAIQRRHDLDDLARHGQGVPAQLTRVAEEEIRAAEVDAIRTSPASILSLAGSK